MSGLAKGLHVRGSRFILCEFCDFTRYVSASKAVTMYHGCTHSISSENIVLERWRGGEEEGGGRNKNEKQIDRGAEEGDQRHTNVCFSELTRRHVQCSQGP